MILLAGQAITERGTIMEAMTLLINGQAGIYAAHSLARNFDGYLFLKMDRIDPDGLKQNGDYFARFSFALDNNQWLDGETVETVFNPDNKHCDENIEYCFYLAGLYIQNNHTKQLHRLEFIEGDIWAIHPNAIWCDQTETYIFEGAE